MINKFETAMLDAGIEPPRTIIADSILHRFKINGKSSGWYVLHGGDYWAGAFGDWRTGDKYKWRQEDHFNSIDDAQYRQKIQQQREIDKLERLLKQRNAAQIAVTTVNSAIITNDDSTDYCVRKKISIVNGSAYVLNNRLIIPIYDKNMRIVSLQTIDAAGNKRFLAGGEKKGCFGIIGDIDGASDIIICEGYATGVSLHDQFGATVIVALDAGNLTPVAINIRAIFPAANIIIAADNDASGIGLKMAIAACHAIDCQYIIPPVLGDFNDYFTR